MQAPAAIAQEGRDGGAWRLAVAVLHGLAAAAVLAWGASVWLAPAGLAVALWQWRREPIVPRALAWDGRGWRLGGAEGRPHIALDLGGWMLLSFETTARRHWLALSPAADPAGWPALRAALHGSAAPRITR